MRSPSQRWRLSIEAPTCRRGEVAFAISRVEVSTGARPRRPRRRRRSGRRSPGSGRGSTFGWPARRVGDVGGGRGLAADANLERLEAAQEQPAPDRAPGRCRSGRGSVRSSSGGVPGSRQTTAPSSASSWPGEVLRRAVERRSRRRARAAAGRIGVATVASTTTGAGCAAAASRSGIVRNGFAGASTQMSCTPSGGGPVWSNST